MSRIRSVFGDDSDLVLDTDFRVLLVANLSAPLGTALVSPLLDSLLVPLSVSEAEVGLVMSAFTAPSIVLTPLVGKFSDRYGRKPILVVGLLVFGAAGTAVAAASNFATVVGLRFLQGIGYAGVTPILVTSIGDLYSGNTEATAQGLRFTSSGIVQTVFPVVASVLVLASWRYPFLLYATALPVCLVVYRWFDEPTDRIREDGTDRARGEDTDRASDGDGSDPGDPGPGHPALSTRLRAFARLVLARHVAAVVLARATPVFVYFGFLTYNSIIVRTMGGTPTDAGVLVAVASVVYAASASQAGRVNAFFESRTAPLVLTNLGMALAFVVVALAPSVPVLGVGVVVLGFCFGISLTLYRSLLTSLVTTANRGGVVAVGEAVGRAAITVVPVVMGGLLAVAEPFVGFDAALRLMVLAVGVAPNLLAVGLVRYAPGPDSPADRRATGERAG